jgi:hypothetical protein
MRAKAHTDPCSTLHWVSDSACTRDGARYFLACHMSTRQNNDADGDSDAGKASQRHTQRQDTAARHSDKTQRQDTAARHSGKTQRQDTATRHSDKTQRQDTATRHSDSDSEDTGRIIQITCRRSQRDLLIKIPSMHRNVDFNVL